jgi:hypothetical protein
MVLLPALLHANEVGVGEVIFLAGGATVTRDGETLVLERGQAIHVGDRLVTSQDAYVHVRFVDGGLISLRPGSRVLVDTYRFDADAPGANRVRITLEEGVLRSATGKAGQVNKQGFRVNTPIAAIGIRGTDFVVFADSTLSRLAVNQGGVVMAPFDGGDCLASGFAPCSGDSSAELFASVSKALLEVRAGQDYALVTADGPTPDEISPPHPEEASLFEAFISGAQAAIRQQPGLSAPGAESYEDGLENARRYLREETLVQQAYALGELESDSPLPTDRNLVADRQLVWGRWSYYQQGNPDAQSIAQLIAAGRQYAVINSVFAMLEDRHDDRPMPESGRASFKLNSYDAYIKRGSSLEAAGISNPALIVDFDQNRFATRLDVHAASLPGVVHVLGAGELSENGFFRSDASSLATIDGVLSPNAAEAGLLFDYQVSPGVHAVGATHWVNGDALGIDMLRELRY